MDRTETELDYITYTGNSVADLVSFIIEANPKTVAWLYETFDKKTVLDIYKMQGQLRMTDEEKEQVRRKVWDDKTDKNLEKFFGTSQFIDYSKIIPK